ncbi:TetR/AcrR family transcriptional regulator [Marinimicrobium agarilyticum]|uniref:TetR/AcrR family transcriptional regulator n=1 Tax=Marinimicrobium agarilyticum TaxID=306546 RepID=UPI0004816031|nr:TetR/AcrR family transcriptional regulator [Marinimicrobium agarilyticum]
MDKQEQLVRTAFKLFYTRGIHAVGINLVLAESGIAKKTLYHHFPSKEHLVEAAVRYRDRSYRAWFISRLDGVSPGRPALLELFNALDDWFHNRVSDIDHFHGCFFINASAEFGDRDSAIHRACAEHKAGITMLIRKHVALLYLSEKKADEITRLVVLLKEGAISLAHVQGNLDAALEAKGIVEGLL